jgi:3-methylfumaryl-CoA hydratase
MPDDLGDFSDWVGRERLVRDVLTLERARKLAATLDADPAALSEGSALPPGWHWIYFHEAVRRAALAEDGHEKRGDFLPPVPLPRRMWAGGRLRFQRPLRIGDEVSRVSRIVSVKEKEGRTGPLAFVTVEHTLSDATGAALVEEQDIVYLGRPTGDAGTRPGAGPRPDTPADWTSTFEADEVTLFRFSALTFNGHRIHYDRPYATDVEGYAGLVVHGPLLALVMLGTAAGWAGDGHGVERFEYRSLQPLFCRESITFRGRRGPTAREGSRTLDLSGDHAERGVVIRGLLSVRPA